MEIRDDGKNRGAIHSVEAYAQGKMLNHSEWRVVLPRNITPSDVDMVFDNSGNILFCEVSSQTAMWGRLSIGQQRIYQELCKRDRCMSVLLYHEVPVDRQIDTANDIVLFSVMASDGTSLWATNPMDGGRWQTFVKRWFDDSEMIRNKVIEIAKADY